MSDSNKTALVLLAGGSGNRMLGQVEDKILAHLAGKPVFAWSLDAFREADCIDCWIIVHRDEQQRASLQRLVDELIPQCPVFWVEGGKERADSVRNGLACLPKSISRVLIHDAARPLVQTDLIHQTLAALNEAPGAVPAHPVVDTIKQIPQNNASLNDALELKTLDRKRLWAMETPQAFQRQWIEKAYSAAQGELTDDASAIEAIGGRIRLIHNTRPNPKLTTPADFQMMEHMLKPQKPNLPLTRIGFGYDIHRFAEGRPLVLGGVTIPSPKGLDGHSDADVLTHAIADAIFGAVGLPDIGVWFANDDPEIAGIDSLRILAKAVAEAARIGFGVGNVDCALIAEFPKISPHLQAMKERLAPVLGVDTGSVGIKATTQEQIGALGQGAGIAAHAVVLLSRN